MEPLPYVCIDVCGGGGGGKEEEEEI